MSRHGASIKTVSPDKDCIYRKKEKKSEILIKGNESILEQYNPSKKAKVDSIIDEKKSKKTPPFKNKQDYIGGTNYKTREFDDSPSDTDGCAINLGN